EQLIAENVQLALCNDLRIEHPDGPRSRIARIGEERQFLLGAVTIDLFEGFLRQIDLGAYFDFARLPRFPILEAERDRADGSRIACPHFAPLAVAAGHRAR